MARSAALNPASLPFLPGGLRVTDDDRGNGLPFIPHGYREQDRSSLSSHSISPSDYLSVKSSPSPPQGKVLETGIQYSAKPREAQRQSPTFRQTDASKPYPAIETRAVREGSILGTLGTLPEREDTQSAAGGASSPDSDDHLQTPGSAASFHQQHQQQRHYGLSSSSNAVPIPIVPAASSSPASSHGSHIQATLASDFQSQSFDSQLRASPIIGEILERVVLCEYTSRELQRDLGDINRKVNLLVERALGVSSQPEFKDPFASHPSTSTLKPRLSIGNIAPNQAANTDDITSISQRLNTLTSSVGQLLALQTQQMQQSTILEGRSNSVISLNNAQMDLAPNQILSPPGLNVLGHGLPNRPDLRPAPRHPNPPLRTWSAGNLELPIRPSDQVHNRQDTLRDKQRKSISGLFRRDSSGFLDSQDNWNGNSRENGPMISKWEQLSLAPELLRSLGKFGVGPPNKIQQRALPFLLRGADIIAQAPPTQERIAAYVIPAIQVAVTNLNSRSIRGPIVVMVSTTVDQATQAQRMIRDLGGPIGVRSALGVGTVTPSSDLTQELRLLQQNMPHIICGTPQKLHSLFTASSGLVGSDVRFLVLDEVDQLIARNLHEFVFNIVKLLPPPRSRPLPSATPTITSPEPVPQTTFTSPFEPGNPVIPPFSITGSGRRFSPGPTDSPTTTAAVQIERQTALFSNTVPQDVLNLASAIQLREPVRVLVRRDGNVASPESSQGSRGLRQYYLYLAFTAGGRSDPLTSTAGGGLGIIGSGRSASSAETTQAREWKLDALADIFDDVEVIQAIVHVGGMTALDSVVYKLASRGLEAIPLHGDMNAATRVAALNKFRASSITLRPPTAKVLVIYDVQFKPTEVPHIPLVINYDLPKAVEEYSHRVSCAIASNYSRAGVVVNFVTATGGDVEMLRSIECFYKIKCPEVPMTLRDIV